MKQIIQSYKEGKIFLSEVPESACKARARPDLVRQVLAKAKNQSFLSIYKEAMNHLDELISLG